MSSVAWLIAAIIVLLVTAFVIILPAYTILLAGITILRAKWRTTTRGGHGENDKTSDVVSPWSRINTSLFQGTVFHIRQQPKIHSFSYPLYFSVVDLDEASELFGGESVQPQQTQKQLLNAKGTLWPLSSLMCLRDVDHLKNGEGLPTTTTADSTEVQNLSMRERISNLVHARTGGKLDLRSTINGRRKILLVTHLVYYGYCFNPVSFYLILKPNANDSEEEEIEAVVAEVSNTPWNEMFIYVLHPESVDTFEYAVYPYESSDSIKSKTYRYKMRKNFHVSPFMTMDHDYAWKFQVSRNRLKVEVKLIKRKESSGEEANATTNGENNENDGILYFTGGFDIQRTIEPTTTYPLQLARVIFRFPIYCFIIQLWIHYEAIRLLMKGVEFIPHPEGSETGASKVIAVVMRPVFAVMDAVDVWWSKWKSRGKGKIA
ncbi:hypothetical protein ACHAXR_002344 [Thalassiosira sp. AJA248-18]